MSNNPWDPTKGPQTQAPSDVPALGEPASNVIPLDGRKPKGRKPKAEGDERLPPAEIYREVSAMIRRAGTALLPAKFEEVFLAVSSDSGRTKTIVEADKDGVCHPIALQRVTDCVLRYCAHQIYTTPGYRLDHRHSIECAKFWLAETDTVDPPAPFLFKSQPGYCYRRIPFDPSPGATPLFDEFFERMAPVNRREFKAWIGSLFDLGADRQQYVWLYGHGGDGKGAIARVLQRVMTPSALMLSSAPKPSNKHWAVPFDGPRLVVFTDITDTRVLMSGEMRSLTGGDRLYADPKGRDGYFFDPRCKLLFLSNDLPSLSAQRADTRRIIFVEMMQGACETDPYYEDKLWLEAEHFIAECIELYRSLCPDRGPIPLSEEAVDATLAMGAALGEENDAFVDEHVQITRDPNDWVSPEELQKKLSLRWGTARGPKLEFISWLRKTHGIRRERVKLLGGARAWGYRGMKLKPTVWRGSMNLS